MSRVVLNTDELRELLNEAVRQIPRPPTAEEVAVALLQLLGRTDKSSVDDATAPLLDRQRLADALGVSKATVDRLRKRPGFPAHLVGDAPRFVESEVRRWLDGANGGSDTRLRLVQRED